MKSRDEIIELVRELRFSSAECFWSLLNQYTYSPGIEGHLRWPQALGHITLEEWNRAYEVSMEMCADMVGYTAPGAQPVQ